MTCSGVHSTHLAILVALGLGGCNAPRALDGSGSAEGSDVSDGGDGESGGSADVSVDSGHCPGEVPIIVDGVDTGYHRCPDGTIHRNEAIACADDFAFAPCQGTEVTVTCTTDSDCGGGPLNRCVTGSDWYGDSTCSCITTCIEDSDCGEGQHCLCPGIVDKGRAWATCESAGCLDGSDCESGECGVSAFNDGCGWINRLECRAADDLCRLDSECGPGESCMAGSEFGGVGEDQGWRCAGPNCAIGRPLHCGDEVRTAKIAARSDWVEADLCASARGMAATLHQGQHVAALEHWTTVALMEHASVASFARFTLDLMTFGAPPELLALAQQAAADEVRHAQLAFAVASGLGGGDAASVGPGPMRLDDVPLHTDLEAFAIALVREGCVGETCGAAEAAEGARGVTDPALRSAMETIAADEQRHAVLAWKTLQWVWPKLSSEARARVMDAARDEAMALSSTGSTADETSSALAEVGVLGTAATASLRADVWRTVVSPTLEALGSSVETRAPSPVSRLRA